MDTMSLGLSGIFTNTPTRSVQPSNRAKHVSLIPETKAQSTRPVGTLDGLGGGLPAVGLTIASIQDGRKHWMSPLLTVRIIASLTAIVYDKAPSYTLNHD